MTRVIKIGGRAQSAPELIGAIASEWHRGYTRVCIVHGGGDEISTLQRALGIEPVFMDGRRSTTARDLDLVRMVLSGAANKRLVAALAKLGVPAWGISGEDGGLLEAEPLPDFGHAGVPSRVNSEPLRLILDNGFLPVVSPLARNAAGSGALNVNGDDAASALAAALQADELLFVSDVDGVVDEQSVTVPRLTAVDAMRLIETGSATGGMAAKLQAAERALAAGVRRVRVASVAGVSDSAAGTLLLPAPQQAIT